jgi:hypothetical protein
MLLVLLVVLAVPSAASARGCHAFTQAQQVTIKALKVWHGSCATANDVADEIAYYYDSYHHLLRNVDTQRGHFRCRYRQRYERRYDNFFMDTTCRAGHTTVRMRLYS